jgi:hypothetical protein
VAGDGIPDEQIDPVAAAEKDATVAAVDEPPHAAGAVPPEIPHRGGNSYAGHALGGHKAGGVRGVVEEAEHGRCSMKCAQAAKETGSRTRRCQRLQTRAGLEKEDASGGRWTRIKERRSSLSSGGTRATGEVMASRFCRVWLALFLFF